MYWLVFSVFTFCLSLYSWPEGKNCNIQCQVKRLVGQPATNCSTQSRMVHIGFASYMNQSQRGMGADVWLRAMLQLMVHSIYHVAGWYMLCKLRPLFQLTDVMYSILQSSRFSRVSLEGRFFKKGVNYFFYLCFFIYWLFKQFFGPLPLLDVYIYFFFKVFFSFQSVIMRLNKCPKCSRKTITSDHVFLSFQLLHPR